MIQQKHRGKACTGSKKNNGAQVDFAAIWGMQHTKAKETGNSDTNFIKWVEGIVKEI